MTPEPVIIAALQPEEKMKTMLIDGNEYVGYLEMPTIEMSLPALSELKKGDPVQFIDAEDVIHSYTVDMTKVVGPYDVEEVVNGT